MTTNDKNTVKGGNVMQHAKNNVPLTRIFLYLTHFYRGRHKKSKTQKTSPQIQQLTSGRRVFSVNNPH